MWILNRGKRGVTFGTWEIGTKYTNGLKCQLNSPIFPTRRDEMRRTTGKKSDNRWKLKRRDRERNDSNKMPIIWDTHAGRVSVTFMGEERNKKGK